MTDQHLYRVREADDLIFYVVAKNFRHAVELWATTRLKDEPDKYGTVSAVLAVEQPEGVDLVCESECLILPCGESEA